MQIYTFDEASFLIKNTIRRYKDVNNLEKKIEIALSAMMINYVNWCFSEGEVSLCYEPLEYIKRLPNNFEVAFSKILGQYFTDLLNHRTKDARKIRDVLSKAGYQVYVKKMMKAKK